MLFLPPPAPDRIEYREIVEGRVVCQRQFDSVRLWELDPDDLLRMGPGPATLVGRARLALPHHVRRAARMIGESTAWAERNDLLFILQALCGGRYTAQELGRMIPREAVMASVMFAKEFRQARVEGRTEAARGLCLAVVKRRHPGALARVSRHVQACDSLATLERWTVAAAELPADRFVRLVARAPLSANVGATVTRRRAPRPSRRTASRRTR